MLIAPESFDFKIDISKMLPRINKPMGWLIYTHHGINKDELRKVRLFYKDDLCILSRMESSLK